MRTDLALLLLLIGALASGCVTIGRATQGVRVIQLDEDDDVVSAIRAPEEEPVEPAAWRRHSPGFPAPCRKAAPCPPAWPGNRSTTSKAG